MVPNTNNTNYLRDNTMPEISPGPSISNCTIIASDLSALTPIETLSHSTIASTVFTPPPVPWQEGGGGGGGGGEGPVNYPKTTQIDHCNIRSSQIRSAGVQDSTIAGSRVSNISAIRLDCDGSQAQESRLRRSRLVHSRVFQSTVAKSRLQGSNVEEGLVRGSNLVDSSVKNSKLSGVTLRGCSVSNCVLLKGMYVGRSITYGVWRGGELVGNAQDWVEEDSEDSEDEIEYGVVHRTSDPETRGLMERDMEEREQAHYEDPPPPYSETYS